MSVADFWMLGFSVTWSCLWVVIAATVWYMDRNGVK